MQAGDLVWIEWHIYSHNPYQGSGVIVEDTGFDFFKVLCSGQVRLFHSDYLRVMNEGG